MSAVKLDMSAAMTREVDEWVDFIHHLARLSAGVIKPYYRTNFEVDTKADASPVTIADREAELAMRKAIMDAYPDHGILGEEYGPYQSNAPYQWVLDPIDGTKSFVSGSYLFGTLIALVKDGRPLLGAINHPIFDDFLLGDGRHAWLNGSLVHTRPCAAVEDAVMLNTEHWNVRNYHDGPAYEALTQRVKRYNNWGDCHGYYLLATGGADIMTDPILNPWDLMALIPIVEGAGGRITDWHGASPLTGAGAVATAGTIHDEVVAALNPA